VQVAVAVEETTHIHQDILAEQVEQVAELVPMLRYLLDYHMQFLLAQAVMLEQHLLMVELALEMAEQVEQAVLIQIHL
jgi:hypothetical protein